MARAGASDDDLLAAVADDPEAFGVFYRRHAEAVLGYLLYRTRSAEQALELTAETFAAALHACRRYRPGAVPARGWLFGIANHKLADSRRRGRVEDRARRRIGLERPGAHDEQLERVEELIDSERREPPLELLLAGLPPRQRGAVLARVVDEREYAEIALTEGCSEPAARQLVTRGLARLGALLREERT
jgi:RNA polymerase sigma-70 factor (ECF subfamily)